MGQNRVLRMLTCRSISTELWVHARQCLIFYFSRRHGLENAEDLAQETLAALWSRDDYEFEQEPDFLKVCYGFARKILYEEYRRKGKHAGIELNPNLQTPIQEVKGLKGTEVCVFLDEVRRRAKAELLEEEWALIENAVNRDAENHAAGGKVRVQLHRARKKLARLTGWQE